MILYNNFRFIFKTWTQIKEELNLIKVKTLKTRNIKWRKITGNICKGKKIAKYKREKENIFYKAILAIEKARMPNRKIKRVENIKKKSKNAKISLKS